MSHSTKNSISQIDPSDLPPPWRTLVPMFMRIGVWILFFLIIYLMRSFFLLVFLTFVFSYIQAHGVEKLSIYIGNRTLRVVFVGLLFLGVLISISSFLVPRVKEQASLFIAKYNTYLHAVDKKIIPLMELYPVLEEVVPQLVNMENLDKQQEDSSNNWDPRKSPTLMILQQSFGNSDTTEADKSLKQTIGHLKNLGGRVFAVSSAFLLSLLFSFLIVLDLPKLTNSVKGLRETKLKFVYDEVAENIYSFGKILGRALEAQLFIAIINAILTSFAIYLMGLQEKIAFLAVIVFLCSFIPVAGVFVSSVPICLVALQESGIGLVLIAIGAILLIHFIETYILNPKIFGHHLRLNPVIVLIILTIGGELFHVWGLVLGLPVCTYIFSYAIRWKKEEQG